MDPAWTAESFPSPPGLGEAPALFQQDAESFSNQGGAPAFRMYSESSASNSAFFSEGHVSLRHKLSEVATKLSVMVACLQECVSTLVELQSDSFNQQDAQLERRESSLGSLTSRNLGNNSNNKQEEERSSLGEFTPRTCKSKSEEGAHSDEGAHPEKLEQDELEQEEAKQQEQREAAEAKQLTAQQTGPEQQQQQQASRREAKEASKTQEMVQHMLEERPHNRSLLVQLPAAQPAAPTSLDNTKPNAATDCSSFSGDTGA